MKFDFIGWVFQVGIFINQDTWILWIAWKTWMKSAVLILTAPISLFYRINKLGGWNNIIFNLCSITYLYKLLNLNYNYFLLIPCNCKIVRYLWSVKSGSAVFWKTRIVFYSINTSESKNPRKFSFCVFKRDYP